MTTIDPQRTAVLALHWQVNIIKPEGFFGVMYARPVAKSGVVGRSVAFHESMAASGVPILFTRFTIPDGEGELVRNTGFMRVVAEAQESFRPNAPGTQLIPEMVAQAKPDLVFDNQKLSGLAGNNIVAWLTARGIDTILITGVATNLTVEQTARHGTDLGLTVYTVNDCVTAAAEQVHAASLNNLELATGGCLSSAQILN